VATMCADCVSRQISGLSEQMAYPFSHSQKHPHRPLSQVAVGFIPDP